MENNTQPTTLHGFKDQVAKEYFYQGASYKDWASMEKQLIHGVPYSSKAQSTKDLLKRHGEAWDRLAIYLLRQAKHAAWNEGYEARMYDGAMAKNPYYEPREKGGSDE